MYLEGGVLEVYLPGRGANDLLWGRVCLGTKGRGEELFRLALKQIFSKKSFKYFPYTLRVPSTD